jgi:hypothetical protein
MTDVYPDGGSGGPGSGGGRWRLGPPLGQPGGEGQVFEIIGQPSLVAKIYRADYLAAQTGRRSRLERKLTVMIGKQPTDPTLATGHVSIAWPRTILRGSAGGQCIGFAMPRAPAGIRVLHRVFSPTDLREDGLPYDWRFQVGVGHNLAAVFHAMHEPGRYVIGDPNPNNFLVANQGLVTMVDCDSVQVDDGRGNVFLCEVAMPDLLPPEFVGKNMTTERRDVSLDNWALALLLYRALMRDARPYSGWQSNGQAPELATLARRGLFNQLPSSPLRPTKATPPLHILPPRLRGMFVECFTEGGADPSKRPTAAQWRQEFATLSAHLVSCPRDKNHTYSDHLSACPWCQLATTTNRTATGPTQVPVPPLGGTGAGGWSGPQPGPGPTVVVPGQPGWPVQPGRPAPGQRPAPVPPQRRRGAGIATVIVVGVLIATLLGVVIHAVNANKAGLSSSSSSSSSGNGGGGPTAQGGTSQDVSFGQQASQVDGILRASGSSRRQVVAANADVDSCDVADGQQTLSTVVTDRDSQISQANNLAVDQLPNGEQIRRDLLTVLQDSQQADRDFLQWAQDIGSCTGGASHQDSHYTDGLTDSKAATDAKVTFLDEWSSIAGQAGLPSYQEPDI